MASTTLDPVSRGPGISPKTSRLAGGLFLPADAFVRSVGTYGPIPYSLFLGAGASVSSGVPSADQCLWRWKRDIVVSNNPGIERLCSELSLASVRSRVQEWLDAEGRYPSIGADDEYQHYAEEAYPIPEDRRRFFERLAKRATPSSGYYLLGLLAESRWVQSVWTTNFDGLASRGGTLAGATVIDIGPDSANRVDTPRAPGILRHISLHGDYRYDTLANTTEELQDLDQTLRAALLRSLTRDSLIVVGYSGRDESIMNTLSEAYSERGSGRLFWCLYADEQPSSHVEALVERARRTGREAYLVKANGFDNLMHRISQYSLTGPLLDRATEITTAARNDTPTTVPFRIPDLPVRSILKSNAFLVEPPNELFQLDVSGYNSRGAWQRLKVHVKGQDIVAGLVRRQVLALGHIDEVRRVFKDQLRGPIVRTPLHEGELRRNSVVRSLLTQAIVRSISATRGLDTNGSNLLWTTDRTQSVQVFNCQYHYFTALRLSLRFFGDDGYMVIKPTIRVVDPAGDSPSADVEREVKRSVLTKQWNKQFNDVLNNWRTLIFQNRDLVQFEFPAASGSRFAFQARRVPAVAGMSAPRSIRPKLLADHLRRLATQHGTEFPEPELLFSSVQGSGRVHDSHPIRGLVENRPYDYHLTTSGLGRSTRIGVVSPRPDAPRAAQFLAGLREQARPDTKREYLLPYPGFSAAFGTSLDLPQPGMGSWVYCSEPQYNSDPRDAAQTLRRELQRRIDQLQATYNPQCILIYVPTRWAIWERYVGDGEYFDLHDFVKAYCVERGVATQFLRERTTRKSYRTEIMWWLALSFYVKSGRTPWMLKTIDSNTAFVGLGFSIDPVAPRGRHVLLGCSHIYNAQGLGLNYRLSTLANSRMGHRNNPFLSREDARRMGESTRELFFDAHGSLPKRVVIHKRTPFREEERKGLLDGLGGIDEVEMVEITIDNELRYVASRQTGTTLSADGYPVRRGSAIVLEDDRALLWVHGSADPVGGAGNPYYLGKSRIPAPLVLRRHYGQSDFRQICTEILGLSKMNWNTFDLYTKLPTTVQSSNTIARIGLMLERFGPQSYDYRLFI